MTTQPLRALVVEDNQSWQQILSEILSDCGLEVDVTGSLEEATNSLAEIERSAMAAMQIVQENLSHLRPIRMEKIRIASCVADAIRGVQTPAGI